MAAVPQPLSLEEYLETSYSPDCEFVDGLVIERNVGQGKHSYTQGKISRFLDTALEKRGLFTLPEQRTKVSPYRVRIPDVSVVEELEAITTKPPLLCVEILSPDDRWKDIMAKVSDYLEIEVPCIWIVDPWTRRAWIFDSESGPSPSDVLTARKLELAIPLETVLPPA